MAEAFLSLDARDRADILRTVAARSGRAAIILEKDVWVCWCAAKRRQSSAGANPARQLSCVDASSDCKRILSLVVLRSAFLSLLHGSGATTERLLRRPAYFR